MKMNLLCDPVNLDGATWADVEAVLPELKDETFFRLTIIPRPKTGPKSLEVQAENGNYMPVMGVVLGRVVYAFRNHAVSGRKEMVEIGGYEWDATSVTQDYDLIVRMIKEFYHTGNVPVEWWEDPQPTKSE